MEKPTGAKRAVKGVQFICWHVGVNKTEWRSSVGTIRSNFNLTGYNARTCGGHWITSPSNEDRVKRFGTFENAARALIKYALNTALNQHYAEEDMRPV